MTGVEGAEEFLGIELKTFKVDADVVVDILVGGHIEVVDDGAILICCKKKSVLK